MVTFLRRYFWHLAQVAVFVAIFAFGYSHNWRRFAEENPTATINELNGMTFRDGLLGAFFVTLIFAGFCLLVEQFIKRRKQHRSVAAPRLPTVLQHGRGTIGHSVGKVGLLDERRGYPRLVERVPSSKKLLK